MDIIKNITNNNVIPFIIFFGGLMTVGYIVAQKVGLRQIQAYFKNGRLYLKYYKFNSEKVKKIVFIELKSVKQFYDFAFGGDKKFEVSFKGGGGFTMYKSRIWNKKDDFEILISDFKRVIKTPEIIEQNSETDTSKIDIKYTDFYDQPVAKLFFLISIALTIGLVLGIIFKKIDNAASLAVAFTGLIGYIGSYLIKKNIKK